MRESRWLPGSFRVLLFLLIVILVVWWARKSRPLPTPPPSPTPAPVQLLPRKDYNTARLFNGIWVKSLLKSTPTNATALHLEGEPDSYQLQLELHLRIPKPAITQADLLDASPELDTLIPHLDQILQQASASPDFETLFEHKEKNLRSNLTILQRLLPRDTIYDCQTILDLEHPETKRHALLIQALMDVNADGSDGDRNLPVGKLSAFFQPQTNYRWPKVDPSHPNPWLHETQKQLASLKSQLKEKNLGPEEKIRLENAESETQATIDELKRWSFLVGTADPFIVLPSFMFKNAGDHLEIGDYAIVISHGVLYPAIVGDKGPNFKIGEASLRICKEIDGRSTPDSRPVDHPTVVYLVFPGTAEKPFSSPDYARWSDRCHALWKEFGGSDSAPWKEWDSLEKPWPTPTPSPTPLPTPTPTPTPLSSPTPVTNSSEASPVPGTSPSPSSTPSPLTNIFISPTPSPITGTNPAAFPSPLPVTSPTASPNPTTPISAPKTPSPTSSLPSSPTN